jgi:hypothetical protein
MNQIELALTLKSLGRNIFLHTNPEILDFTNPERKYELIILTQTKEIKIDLSPKNLIPTISLLSAALENTSIIGWNIKNLFTYVLSHTKALPNLDAKLIDLKALEAFLGFLKPMPISFLEAAERLKVIFQDTNWKKAKEIHTKIHLPLIKEVLPSLEVTPLVDSEKRQLVHAYYELEGQANGRLRCEGAYKRNYIPHTMSIEQRKKLKPNDCRSIFMYFDYSHMEVSMLQWLSKDERLEQVLGLEEDLYKVVYKLVTGGDCNSDKKREICKGFFLPVIYGMGTEGLIRNIQKQSGIEVSIGVAEKIISRIYGLFPRALEWIQEQGNSDYFGRRRVFEDGRHRVRNFVVQSPASLVCLEKLIKLHGVLKEYAKLACTIHDGYVILVDKMKEKMVEAMAKDALCSESELCPGLKLKVICKIGL